MAHRTGGGFLSRGTSRLIWFAVVGVALFLSGWSIWWLGVRFGAPPWLALFGSVAFDGGRVALTDYAVRHTSSGLRGGAFARGCGLFLLAVSITLNASHAILAHHAWVAALYYAIPSVVAYTMLEAHFRWQHAALRPAKNERVELPHFHWLAWMFSDARHEAWQQVREAVHPAQGEVRELEGTRRDSSSITLELPATPQLRRWAQEHGHEVKGHGPLPASVEKAWVESSANGHH